MKHWLSGCDEAMKIRMDGSALRVQIEQQCKQAKLLISAYRHIDFTQQFGRLMVKALKGQVSRYMQVRHTRVYPLASVSTLTEEVSIVAIVQYIYLFISQFMKQVAYIHEYSVYTH